MEKEVNIFQKIISSVLIILGIILILFINNNMTGKVIGGQETSINLTEIIVLIWAFLMIVIGIWIGIKKQIFSSIIPHQ